jgi:hypothetical protein
VVVNERPASSHHYLFYFRDETFECDADGWRFQIIRTSDEEYAGLRASGRFITLGPTGTLRETARKYATRLKNVIRHGE